MITVYPRPEDEEIESDIDEELQKSMEENYD